MVEDMYVELARMERTYRRYVKHGAIKAAEALEDEIEDLRNTIKFEEHLLRCAFD